jgi:uncharacterized protein YdhG (YjbR/CyaY superfamily)
MDMTPTTVGAYLRDLPPDRRVAMARVCSMIRRSARGVRESMRYGLAFYELDGPLFALESGRRHMSLYVAEQDVIVKHKDALPGINAQRSFIKFSDLTRLPLDVVEKIVRDSVAARRSRVSAGTVPTQAEALKLWAINEEKAAPPPGYQVISTKPPPGAEGEAEAAVKPAAETAGAKKSLAAKPALKAAVKAAAKVATAVKAAAAKVAPAKAAAAKAAPARKSPAGKAVAKAPAKAPVKAVAGKAARKAPAKPAKAAGKR